MWKLKVKFYLGQNKDCSPGHSTLDSSENLLQSGRGKYGIYAIWMKQGYMQSSAYFFCRKFLLVSWSFCWSWERVATIKDFSSFLDMRKYKDWAHKISFWEYLTIWRSVLPGPTPPPWTPSGSVEGQQLSCCSTWFNPCGVNDKHPRQVPFCSWHCPQLGPLALIVFE